MFDHAGVGGAERERTERAGRPPGDTGGQGRLDPCPVHFNVSPEDDYRGHGHGRGESAYGEPLGWNQLDERGKPRKPYVMVTLFAWICIWVIPFWFLLGQRPKQTWWWLGGVASVSVFGFWVERNVLIWPSLVPDDSFSFLGWIQIGVALGFLGAFSLTYLIYTRLFPSLAVPSRS